MVLALMIILALTACGGGTPSNTTGGGASSSGGEVYEINFNTFIPEVIAPGKATRDVLNYIEAESGGRIKFKDYWDGTYVSFAETIQAVVTGVVDIGFIDPGHLNESFYANQIISMNVEADVPSRKGQTEALIQATREIPELQQEMEKMGLMWLGISSAGSGNNALCRGRRCASAGRPARLEHGSACRRKRAVKGMRSRGNRFARYGMVHKYAA